MYVYEDNDLPYLPQFLYMLNASAAAPLLTTPSLACYFIPPKAEQVSVSSSSHLPYTTQNILVVA